MKEYPLAFVKLNIKFPDKGISLIYLKNLGAPLLQK